MFNSETGNRVMAAVSALTLSVIALAMAIVPASPGLGVLV